MKEDIQNALAVLYNGGIILYPTDTIWGIGCDATNQKAVEKIYELKKREDSKNMLVLIDDFFRIESYVRVIPEIAQDLVEVSTDPLTIIYPNAKNLAENLIAEDGSIGIRVSSDEFCKKLIYRFKKPIVSTSANISGQKSPTIFDEISPEIIKNVDYVVQYRQNDISRKKTSGIIKLGVGNEVEIIRK